MNCPTCGGPMVARGAVTPEFLRQQERVVAERDRYQAALQQISDADSGPWGWVAYDALHPRPQT